MTLRRIGWVAAIIAVVWMGIGIYNWMRTKWVPAGEVGLLFDHKSGLQEKVLEPGRYIVGWRKVLYTYPTKMEKAVYSDDNVPDRSAGGVNVTTSDTASTKFDVTVLYRVKPQNAVKVFRSFGARNLDAIEVSEVRNATREAITKIGTRYDIFQLMGPKRLEASEAATKEMQAELEKKGISVMFVAIMRAHPSESVTNKINNRVNGFTELEISKIRQQIAQVEREQANVVAQAEAQSRQIKVNNPAMERKSMAVRRIELAQKAITKWNGQLPLIPEPKNGQTLFLPPDVVSAMSTAPSAPQAEEPQGQ